MWGRRNGLYLWAIQYIGMFLLPSFNLKKGGPIGLVSILKPENVSSSWRDIIVSMLWEINFNLICACFDFLGEKTGAEGVSPSLPLPMLWPCKHIEKIKG